jgi:hypothetical protein
VTRKRFRGPNGAVVTFDVPSPGMGQAYFDRKVASGEFVEVPDAAPAAVSPEPEPAPEPEPEPEPESVERPARADAKADWVEFAVACGWSRDDAEAATKADLVERAESGPEGDSGS